MSSTTTNLINTINVGFPIAGQDNDSEGFRTNFNIIQQSLLATESEITNLQNTVNSIGGTVFNTATHIVAIQDVTIGTDVISVDSNYNLVVTAGGMSGSVVLRPTIVTAYGAYALTESVTAGTTGTFAVDDVRNIQINAIVSLPGHTGTIFTVTNVDPASNYITVTPEFSDIPPAFSVGATLSFQNPFFPYVTGFNAVVNYTAATLRTLKGKIGWMAAVSDSPTTAGMIAFWDTTNNRWSYIKDNSAV